MELAVVSDRHLFLYDSVPESTPRTIELHDSGIQSVSWNHKNQILATCGLDGKIAFCTAQDLVEQDIMGVHAKQSAPMYSLCFSHDSHHLAFGGENGMVNLFNLRRKESNIVSGYDSPITSLSYNNNSGLMAFGDVKGNLALYNTVDRSTSRLEDETNQSITNIAFSKLSGSTCAASLYNGLVKVYDTARINAVTTFSIHEKAATGTEFYPNNKTLFVSCGMDKKVAFYSLQQNKHVQTIDVSAPITSMSIRSDGKLLALGRNDGDVTLIDFRNLKSPYGVLRTGTAQSIMSLKYKNKERSRRSHATPTEKGISSSSRTASEQTPMDTTVPTTYKTDKASVNISKVSSNPSDLERDSTFARSSLTSSKESARPSQRDGSSVRSEVPLRIASHDKFSSQPSTSFSASSHSRGKVGNNGASIDAGGKGTVIQTSTYMSGTIPTSNKHSSSTFDSSSHRVSTEPPYQQYSSQPSPHFSSALSSSLPSHNLQQESTSSVSHPPESKQQRPEKYSSSSSSFPLSQGKPGETVASSPPMPSSTIRKLDVERRANPENMQQPAYIPKPPHEYSVPAKDPSEVIKKLREEEKKEKIMQTRESQESSRAIQALEQRVDQLQSAVEHVLSSFQFSVHKDIHNIHLELFRQFEKQRRDLEAVVRGVSVNDEILEEMARLQEENKQLKLRLEQRQHHSQN
eukprot:m.2544 g.2544  ORF g.2544 m.2544 type:complete len:688 (-) comp1833_c0_seq1:38-2101(-)